jgi:hypothetical protein
MEPRRQRRYRSTADDIRTARDGTPMLRRQRRYRSTADDVRSARDGTPMLPNQVPLDPTAGPGLLTAGPVLRAASTTLFRDFCFSPVVSSGAGSRQQVDRWEIGGPGRCALEEEDEAWGEFGDLIEDWFQSGEQSLHGAEYAAVPDTGWMQALAQRLRRFFARNDSDVAYLAEPELT